MQLTASSMRSENFFIFVYLIANANNLNPFYIPILFNQQGRNSFQFINKKNK